MQNTKYSFADKMCWTWVPGEWRTENRSSWGNIIVDFQLFSLQNNLPLNKILNLTKILKILSIKSNKIVDFQLFSLQNNACH